MYYRVHDAITKMQGNIKLMIELGGRGLGKTHAWANYCAKRKGKTIWVRRKSDELRRCCSTFIDYIKRNGDEEIGYIDSKIVEINERGQKITVECYYNNAGEEKVVFLPLSLSHKLKSSEMGVYDMIVYDEFTSITGDYLKDEATLLMEMISTQMRLRDFKAILIGNNVDSFNPIFVFFGISADRSKEFKPIYNGKGMKIGYIHMIKPSSDFISAYEQSAIGLMTAGTKYDAYAKDNAPFDDVEIRIRKNPPNMELLLHLIKDYTHTFIYKCKDDYQVTGKGNIKVDGYVSKIRHVNHDKGQLYSDDVLLGVKKLIKSGQLFADNDVSMANLFDWFEN